MNWYCHTVLPNLDYLKKIDLFKKIIKMKKNLFENFFVTLFFEDS